MTKLPCHWEKLPLRTRLTYLSIVPVLRELRRNLAARISQ